MGGASALGERRFGSLKADRTNWFSPKAPAVAMPKREESSSSRLTTALFDAICDLIFQSTSKTRGAIAGAPSAETKMKKAALTILGALLVAEMAVQMATASEHRIRPGRGHHRWDRSHRQLREPGFSSPQMHEGKPSANETRSCDRFWCYSD
jgi:hypothetical protein